MKTKFLLHGGRLKIKDTRNDEYFHTLTKNLVDGDMLLHIAFARRTPEERLEVFQRERMLILAQTNKDINVVSATESSLIQQINNAGAIHITGGQSPELVRYMQKYPDFLSAITGKTIGGSSAGACLFSKYYWYGEQGKVLEGLGVLPIALFVHYGSVEYHATDKELAKLEPYAKELELLTLEEAEWVVREVEIS